MTGIKCAALLVMFLAGAESSLDLRAREPGSTTPPAETAISDSTPSEATSFDFFKTRVQPIFLKNRGEHARCYGCHVLSSRLFRLEPLSPGATGWSEEQSRTNFQSAMGVVDRDDPSSSKLLVHPLAPEADGDPFHSGGRQFASQSDPDWLVIAEWVRGLRKEGTSAAPARPFIRIYVANSAGDTIEAIDPAANEVVQVIQGIELPHGIVFSPDGARLYVSNEAQSVLDVVDRKSGEVVSKVALSGRPNNLTITKDGSQVLVGIRAKTGTLDVIDTNSLQNVKSIPVDGPVHNVYITPDGKYVVSGSIESKTVTVVDLHTQKIAWQLKFDHPVRPMAFERNSDGSTRRIFVQLSGVHGFAVVDFKKRAEVSRVKLPDHPSGFGVAEGRVGIPSHGIGVTPDGKTLWVNSTLANSVFAYSLPDLKLIGHVALPEVHPADHAPTGAIPDWIAFTPDSKFVYIADSALRMVSVVDAGSLREVKRISVGEVPKRMSTLVVY